MVATGSGAGGGNPILKVKKSADRLLAEVWSLNPEPESLDEINRHIMKFFELTDALVADSASKELERLRAITSGVEAQIEFHARSRGLFYSKRAISKRRPRALFGAQISVSSSHQKKEEVEARIDERESHINKLIRGINREEINPKTFAGESGTKELIREWEGAELLRFRSSKDVIEADEVLRSQKKEAFDNGYVEDLHSSVEDAIKRMAADIRTVSGILPKDSVVELMSLSSLSIDFGIEEYAKIVKYYAHTSREGGELRNALAGADLEFLKARDFLLSNAEAMLRDRKLAKWESQ